MMVVPMADKLALSWAEQTVDCWAVLTAATLVVRRVALSADLKAAM